MYPMSLAGVTALRQGDSPERCDTQNAALTVRATLAAIVTVDMSR